MKILTLLVVLAVAVVVQIGYSQTNSSSIYNVCFSSVWVEIEPGQSLTECRVSIGGFGTVNQKERGVVFQTTHGLLSDGTNKFGKYDFPGSSMTQISGVDGEKFVGTYVANTPNSRFVSRSGGFIYNGKSFSQLFATGIEPKPIPIIPTAICCGKIVGFYEVATGSNTTLTSGHTMPETNSRGAMFDGKTWSKINKPGSLETRPCGISGTTVVGTYRDGQSRRDFKGFCYNTVSQTWETLEVPNARVTTPTGVSGKYIVGDYNSGSGDAPFIYNCDSKTWQYPNIAVQGGNTFSLRGISGKVVLVRYYTHSGDGSSGTHYLLYDLESNAVRLVDIPK